MDEQTTTSTAETTENPERESIDRKIALISFAMDLLKDPEEAILFHKGTNFYNRYMSVRHARICREVAQRTGATIEQVADKEKRTKQQDELITKILAAESINRVDRFINSNFMAAYTALENISGEYTETGTDGDELNLKDRAILLYFATHEDKNPSTAADLQEKDVEDLKRTFKTIDTYYMINAAAGADKEKIWHDFIERENQQGKFNNAEMAGALTTIGQRLFIPSDPEYQNAFITDVSGDIGLFTLDDKGKRLALNINTSFIRMLAQAIRIEYSNGKNPALGIKIYFPTIARELGIDLNHRYTDVKKEQKKKEDKETQEHNETPKVENEQETQEEQQERIELLSRYDSRHAYIHSIIKDLDNIWGILPNETEERKLISVHAYDPKTEMLTFISPYINGIMQAVAEKQIEQTTNDKDYYWSCDLLHASAANERNQAAVEMATRVLVGVQQRGLKPDCKLKQNRHKDSTNDKAVTYEISCQTIVNECPQIRERLKTQPSASQKTQTLKRCFSAMYKILKTKTDLYKYYNDLTITEIIPTSRTLNAVITIKHNGGRQDYKRPPLPLKKSEPQQPETNENQQQQE